MQAKLSYLLFLLLLASFVSSVEDFSATSANADIVACALQNKPDVVTITNTGDVFSEYDIILSGSAASFVTAVPNRISLMPGETAEVENYFHFPKGTVGNYELNVNIRTLSGVEKAFSQNVELQICNDNQLIALNFNQSSCPCTELVYNFSVINTGENLESYLFGLDEFSEYANVSAKPLVLGPGEEENVNLYLKPDCGITGDYIVNFYSIAQNSGIKTKVPILLQIDRCYDYDIKTGSAVPNDENKFNESFDLGQQYNICALDNVSIPIMIDNVAYIGNNYFYSLDGPSFGSLYGDVLRLNGYENGLIYLDLSPEYSDIGEHKFTVNVESQVGSEKRQKVVDVNVSDCYSLGIALEDSYEVCDCVDEDIPFEIYNGANSQETVTLELEGPEFLDIPERIAVESGTSENVLVRSEAECGTNFDGEVKIKASTERTTVEDTTKLKVIPIEECYGVKIDGPRTYDIYYGENLIPINVVQNGVKESNYSVEIEGPEWVTLTEDKFSLKPGEKYSFDLEAKPYNVSPGNYDLTVNINADNVVYRKELQLRVKSENSNFFQTLKYYRYYIYSGLIALVVIILLIIILKERARVWKIRKMIKKAVNNGKNKKKFNWVLLIVILIFLMIIGAILWVRFPGIVSEFLGTYIGYILAGLIVLAIIIFLLSGNSRE